MGEPEGKQGAAFPSEASRMLEAALEQMDGIIQGAKYELPHYFDNFSIQVVSVCYRIAISRDPNVFFSAKDSPQTSEVGEAVKRLREAIQEGGNRGPHAQVCIPTYDLDFQFLKAQVSMHALACRLKIFKMSTVMS